MSLLVITMKNMAKKTGRPLSFDRDAALHAAMLLFWRHGYESTSLADLTQAMGITPPSLYAAYGDKKRLFLAAVDRYANGPQNAHQIMRNAATARDAAQELLTSAAIGFTGSDTPPGCLLATGAISCSTAARDVQMALADIRLQITRALEARIAAEGIADAPALAAHVVAVIQGLSTLARDGGTRAQLLAVAGLAMAVWPH
jgi:AcrR family transcriptional regulator